MKSHCTLCNAEHKDCLEVLEQLVGDLKAYCRYGSKDETKQHIRAIEAAIRECNEHHWD